jgi:DNA repair exonuclease SbcCD ATPase subunit
MSANDTGPPPKAHKSTKRKAALSRPGGGRCPVCGRPVDERSTTGHCREHAHRVKAGTWASKGEGLSRLKHALAVRDARRKEDRELADLVRAQMGKGKRKGPATDHQPGPAKGG